MTGPMFFLLMPIYIGALVDHLGLNDSAAGRLASIELLGFCAASLLATLWIRRFSWRRTAAVSAAALILANICSMVWVDDLELLPLVRVGAGFAAGSMLSVAITALGDTRQTDRNFSLGIVFQLALSGALLFTLPPVIADYGMTAMYSCFALCACVGLAGALFLPVTGTQHEPPQLAGRTAWKPLWGLSGSAAFFLASTAVWAYVERIGVASGLEPDYIGRALGLSVVLSITGPLLAAWLGDRFNRFKVMSIALLGELVCLLFLSEGMGALAYVAVLVLYQFFWNLWVPYQMTVVALADTSGRFSVLIPLFQAAGVALGPALAAAFLTGGNYLVINIIGMAFGVLALALFAPIARETLGRDGSIVATTP